MLPESMRGFAPIIRGIARTNATVTVKQNGYTVYQTYVAPGSFKFAIFILRQRAAIWTLSSPKLTAASSISCNLSLRFPSCCGKAA
jgi:hypothetical protein